MIWLLLCSGTNFTPGSSRPLVGRCASGIGLYRTSNLLDEINDVSTATT